MCYRSTFWTCVTAAGGWSSIIRGLGFLDERFREPHLFIWRLEEDLSFSLAPARVPLRPFCGIMGVAPAEDGEFRTRPPGLFGGNLDVRDLVKGATLYLPVLRPGALFSTGDVHAAQGDGEVCINGIETPAEVSLRFTVRRDFALSAPLAETPPHLAPSNAAGEWLLIETHADPLQAAATATSPDGGFHLRPVGVVAGKCLRALQRDDVSTVEPGG